jgi:transcriptional regulator with PAS, ATPase and Fis domain
VVAFRHRQEERYGLRNLVGDSPAMKDVFRMVMKVGRSAASTVLITGESGTGKDLVAKAIHYASDRVEAPFMNITCSALPETLLESELMGHERGAFTDAKSAKQGLFELADRGTVLLDEIGDMGLVLQAKLLRFLEEKTFRRVGGAKDIKVNVRIIAATNCDLVRAVNEGRFREDLYHRVNVIPIALPPLRCRKEDIPLLAKHFLDEFNREFRKHCHGITDQALEVLVEHDWPGNVRELRNVIERAMLLEDRDLIDLPDLPHDLGRSRRNENPAGSDPGFRLPDAGYRLARLERELVQQALERTGGNQTRAARLLSISRDALRYKMKKFKLG